MSTEQPKTLEEYNDRYNANTRYSGFGPYEAKMHMPCPGCTEPDWLVCIILESEEALAKGATCKHCGRGFKALYSRDGQVKSFKLVQTVGDDLPDFLPQIERAP